uniref:N-acetyltransferase domain-containing protein n=1 Tax=Haemonchus placei TaxID=6290 RepID=A0A158QMZ8_HAEPC
LQGYIDVVWYLWYPYRRSCNALNEVRKIEDVSSIPIWIANTIPIYKEAVIIVKHPCYISRHISWLAYDQCPVGSHILMLIHSSTDDCSICESLGFKQSTDVINPLGDQNVFDMEFTAVVPGIE